MGNKLEELIEQLAIAHAKEDEAKEAYTDARTAYEDSRAVVMRLQKQLDEEINAKLIAVMEANRRTV